MALPLGSQAPDFTLKCQRDSGLVDITLSENFGIRNTVLLFFPFAFTRVCKEELCTVSQEFSEYEQLNAVVYGISVDSPFTQEAFAQANQITIPLLSDFNKEVSSAYGVLGNALVFFLKVSMRSAVVIDPSGRIVFFWVGVYPYLQLPPFEAIKAAL